MALKIISSAQPIKVKNIIVCLSGDGKRRAAISDAVSGFHQGKRSTFNTN